VNFTWTRVPGSRIGPGPFRDWFQKFWNRSNRLQDRFQNFWNRRDRFQKFGPGTRSCSPLNIIVSDLWIWVFLLGGGDQNSSFFIFTVHVLFILSNISSTSYETLRLSMLIFRSSICSYLFFVSSIYENWALWFYIFEKSIISS